MIKTIKYVKLVLYILCFSSLALPMNFDGYSNSWIFGINYITNLFNMGKAKEEIYWFLYYFMLFIVPVVIQILFWKFSKRGIVSDIVDILVGTACSTVMFCFFISFRNSPAGIMSVIVLQILITTMGCLGLVMKIFSQQSFEALILNKKGKAEKKKCPYCGKLIKEGKKCSCRKKISSKDDVRPLKNNSSIDIEL